MERHSRQRIIIDERLNELTGASNTNDSYNCQSAIWLGRLAPTVGAYEEDVLVKIDEGPQAA